MNAVPNNVNEPFRPTCFIHCVPMVLVIYDRPGGPPGNGWSCQLCVAERTAEQETKYVNPNCGCPHPESDHRDAPALGPFCSNEDCRCVDGTYYGKMSDPASASKVFEAHLPSKCEGHKLVEPCNKCAEERLVEQARHKGMNEMLRLVTASLENYPDAGGDIGVMRAVDKIILNAKIDENKRWLTYFFDADRHYKNHARSRMMDLKFRIGEIK